MKRALITGISGQDGSHLADLLLEKGYKVFGLVRRSSSAGNLSRIKHLLDNKDLVLINGDLSDTPSLHAAIKESDPDYIFNLASQSHVRVSFDMPEFTGDITGVGVTRLLEAARQHNPKIRIYQASSSEMFGKVQQIPQSENTPFYPRSPYGVAKLYAHWMCINYRESYNMFICNGILFNHCGSRRGEEFVTRKITKAVANILAGKQHELVLGNLEAKRDWTHAKDCVRGMLMMLEHDTPDDYVLATGVTHSVREFLDLAFEYAGIKVDDYVKFDKSFTRPAEVDLLIGDAGKAKRVLGWEPTISFENIVKEMVDHDLKEAGIVK